MGASDISQFLTWLAVIRHASASTQNQAISALSFLYKDVLTIEIGAVPPVVRARTPERLIVICFTARGRPEECLELGVKDVDFERQQIVVRGIHLRRTCSRTAMTCESSNSCSRSPMSVRR